MKKVILLVFVACISCVKIFAQCAEVSEPRVLLVGDSWAFFMNSESTINYALKKGGHSNYTFVSNATLSVNGAETPDVMTATTENEIRAQLQQHPTIDFVHLSIGGNDFLGDWDTAMTQAQTDTLMMNVFYRLDSIIRFIKGCRPGIKILWSGYTYTNFKEVIETSANPTSHPFYNTWQGMMFPDPHQINTVQNQISTRMNAYCASTQNVYFVDVVGLMQRVYGQTTPLAIPPGGTYAAYTQPMPLGDPDYPSPIAAMRDYVIAKDCFHLSRDGYRYMLGYQTQKFYQKAMMDDLYLLSDAAQTGSVSAQGVVSAGLTMGEAAGDNFSTVLSFNTTTMADTTLSKASIFLKRQGLTGSNPISGSLQLKMKIGSFGTAATVEAADYTASPDEVGTPCLFGSNSDNGDWIRLDLPDYMLRLINHSSPTQFIISAPGVSGSKADFYDSSDPDFAPIMNLKYGPNPTTAIKEVFADHFAIYPNPTNSQLTIEGSEAITKVEITNLLGKTVLHPALVGQTINIGSLASGMYIVNITTKNGVASKKVVKD